MGVSCMCGLCFKLNKNIPEYDLVVGELHGASQPLGQHCET